MGENRKGTKARMEKGSDRQGWKFVQWAGLVGGGMGLLALIFFFLLPAGNNRQALQLYQEKIQQIKEQALSESTLWAPGFSPAGQAGHAVFISVSDGSRRADVYSGTGTKLWEAWQAANERAEAGLRQSGISPHWVKADVVYLSEVITDRGLKEAVLSSRHEFFRYGVAFDEGYELALLEAELNGNRIYAYEAGGLDLKYLNNYLKKAGRATLAALPQSYRIFRCFGWLCDEANQVYALSAGELDYGRRQVAAIDKSYAADLVEKASAFLVDQVKADGSFIYGIYPRFDNDIENYNIVRHASTIWSLICRYRMLPDEELTGLIDQAIKYMLDAVIYADEDTAYLYEEKDDEIKLGGNGVAIIALTEYMDVFDNDLYVDACRKLGNGILALLDQATGEYYHVLNGDFSPKAAYRTVYYDGEATFALCRLYSLTGEGIWLDAARKAVDHFIAADYTQYKDHWIAYSLNEMTKHVGDPAYYTFALANVQKNLAEIYHRDTTYHTYLELLMASFELYDRLIEQGIAVDYLEEFDLAGFLQTIYCRADRMLNGYFYPEYAMYMANPRRILYTFMVRHDGYRIRIDDVQHNIGGYYLYYKNYDKLVSYGLLRSMD